CTRPASHEHSNALVEADDVPSVARTDGVACGAIADKHSMSRSYSTSEIRTAPGTKSVRANLVSAEFVAKRIDHHARSIVARDDVIHQRVVITGIIENNPAAIGPTCSP